MLQNKNGEIKKAFFSLLPVQIASFAVLFLNTLADSITVGKFIGTKYLAVISFAVPVMMTVSMIGSVISVGSQVLCGEKIGNSDKESANSVFSASVIISVGIGIFFSLVAILFSDKLAYFLGAREEEVILSVSSYIKGVSPAFLFMILYKSNLSFMQLENSPKSAFVSTVIMIIMKILFNILLINKGVFGVGLSTFISYFSSVMFFIIYRYIKKDTFVFSFSLFKFKTVMEIVKFGSPNAMLEICMAIRSAVFNNVCFSVGGIEAVSAYSVAGTVGEIMYAGMNGVGGAVLILSSIYVGKKDKTALQYLAELSLKTGFVTSILTFVISMLMSKPFAFLFGAEEEFANECILAIRMLMTASLVNTLPIVTANMYKGMELIKNVNIAYLCWFFVFPVTVLSILPNIFGNIGIWSTYFICDFSQAVVFFVYTGIRIKRIPKKLSEFVYIPDNIFNKKSA